MTFVNLDLKAVPPAPGSPSVPKPPHAATLPSSPPNSACAPLPQVNGGFRAPPHQPEGSEPLQSLCKKRKRKRLGEAPRPGTEVGEAAAPPGKRRRKKRKRPEDTDIARLQAGQAQGQHWSPEGSVERPASSLEAEGGQQPVNGRGLANGWPVGCRTDSPHMSKRRRKGVDGFGGEGEACLRQDPPRRRSCSPSDAEPEATAASPRKKKKKKRKLESRQEGEEEEHPGGWRGPAVPGSSPAPAVNGQSPGDLAGRRSRVVAANAHFVCLLAGPEQTPRHSWPRERGASVVWELLECASDKAYGKKVLTWGGEVSAVSRDAMHDSRLARASTVIDDWDEEFDRGKVHAQPLSHTGRAYSLVGKWNSDLPPAEA
ncbi:Ubiquitin carboxyl-terminal hydrolase 36 [Myotis brandtii]|uniref:Ubiquitin carboxyl-terminal hydrolase 36 n=1 Tax=Myotis brandtii TaxID=109478 RepID=S7NNZ3_MYOBR|nr:Ubiquitin carboxyl-terminal hydrolase 36 [Myotis brandtii]